MNTPDDLNAFIQKHGLEAEIIHLEDPTPTVETAAAAVGVGPDQIVKSVLFLIAGEPVLAVACGTAFIDRRALAARFEVGRKRVKLAGGDTVLSLTGYPAGAVPPFGHPQPLRTVIDPAVLENEVVFAGGGSGHALVRIKSQDILAVTGAEPLSILEQ